MRMNRVELFALVLCVGAFGVAPTALAAEPDAESPAVAGDADAKPASLQERIDSLVERSAESARKSLEMLIDSRRLQAQRPKLAAGDAQPSDDMRERAEAWIAKIDETRDEIEAQRGRVADLRVEMRALRREDVSDEQADELVKIQPGIENSWRALDRGIREIDVATRRARSELAKLEAPASAD